MIYKAVALLFTYFVATNAYEEQEYRDSFTQWMQKYTRSYTNVEFSKRFQIFKDNMDYVQKWNTNNADHKLELNHLADLTNEEYRAIYLGTRVHKEPAALIEEVSNVDLPASVDWRQQGAVTGVKNQGQCGSCWSFSTTGSTEGINKISGGQLTSLSEQNLIDCSTSYGNNGCNGGTMDAAFKYIIANGGLDTEASYPYTTSGPNACKFNKANVGGTLSGYQDVTSGSESGLQTAAAQQPVSVAIDASHTSFQLYSSGVYYEAACSSSKLDHGVLVAGYGTSGSSDYWLVKNSWGTTWGQQGYIWMSRNRNNNCGIATMASYPTKSGGSNSSSGSSGNNSNSSGNNSNSSSSGNNSNSNSSSSGNNSNSSSSSSGNNSNSSSSGNNSNSSSSGNSSSGSSSSGNSSSSSSSSKPKIVA